MIKPLARPLCRWLARAALCTLCVPGALALADASRSVQDAFGRSVTVPQPVTSMIAVGPGALRLIVYLGRGSDVVGIEAIEGRGAAARPYALALEHSLGARPVDMLPLVGAGGPGRLPNLEQIRRLAPDVVVASFLDPAQIEQLQARTGVPVVAVSYGASYGGRADGARPDRLVAWSSSIEQLGMVLQRPERAGQLVAYMNDQRQSLGERLAPAERNASVYIGGLGYRGAQGLTSTEVGYPPFALLGLDSTVLASADRGEPGHRFIQLEALIQSGPDWLFLDALAHPLIRDEWHRHRVLLQFVPAVANAQVHWLAPTNSYNTNIENVFVNAHRIAHAMSDDAPAPEAVARSIYATFLGDAAVETIMRRHYQAYLDEAPPLNDE